MDGAFEKLDRFLTRLMEKRIFYRLGRAREGSVMVEIAVPGHRWEVEFFLDGTIESEVFTSAGNIRDGEEALEELLHSQD